MYVVYKNTSRYRLKKNEQNPELEFQLEVEIEIPFLLERFPETGITTPISDQGPKL